MRAGCLGGGSRTPNRQEPVLTSLPHTNPSEASDFRRGAPADGEDLATAGRLVPTAGSPVVPPEVTVQLSLADTDEWEASLSEYLAFEDRRSAA
jgi:hypothetical protein